MKLTLHPEAEKELQAAAQWYENRVMGLGEIFLSEAIDAFIAIEKHPERFARPLSDESQRSTVHVVAFSVFCRL